MILYHTVATLYSIFSSIIFLYFLHRQLYLYLYFLYHLWLVCVDLFFKIEIHCLYCFTILEIKVLNLEAHFLIFELILIFHLFESLLIYQEEISVHHYILLHLDDVRWLAYISFLLYHKWLRVPSKLLLNIRVADSCRALIEEGACVIIIIRIVLLPTALFFNGSSSGGKDWSHTAR